MHAHLRIQRWVLWWFYIGVVGGVIALVNILVRDLTRSQEHELLLLGVMHWLLGGMVCYALDSVRIEKPKQQDSPDKPAVPAEPQEEWHAASDFLFPGGRKGLLPPRH
jgi:hypothetical protein